MIIIALILAIASILINTITIISMLPYSDNDRICDIQMRIEDTIHSLFEMK